MSAASHRLDQSSFAALALAASLAGGACVRDVAVGTRPSDDDGASDGGSMNDGGPLVCEEHDCEVSVLSTPVCSDYEELACLAEGDACEWKCVVRPLVAGETRCGREICAAEQYCEAPLGTCGQGAEARCLARPEACSREFSPVCGCDGVTYANACDAQRAGTATAREGACAAPAISPCETECEAMAPVEISTEWCPDGTHNPSICAARGDGTCFWVRRKCDPTPICAQPPPLTDAIACWTSADCADGQMCEGASVCPCDAECDEPDRPGSCAP